MSPGFDVTGALVRACRRRGLRHGFYFSVEEYEYPVTRKDGPLALRLWNEGMADGAAVRSVAGELLAELEPRFSRRISGKVPVPDFVADYLLPQAKEFVDRYEPDVLWLDGEWERPSDYYRTRPSSSTCWCGSCSRRQPAPRRQPGRRGPPPGGPGRAAAPARPLAGGQRRGHLRHAAHETHAEATQLGERTWYTRSKDGRYAYAILLDFPRDEAVVLQRANPRHGTEVRLLGHDRPLEWVDTGVPSRRG
jgi:hypothetical protein